MLAFLLFLHVLAFAILVTRRGERGPAVRAAQIAAGLVVLQIVIAASLVELHLPPGLQSLHQATGTLVWVVLVYLYVLARPVRHLASCRRCARRRARERCTSMRHVTTGPKGRLPYLRRTRNRSLRDRHDADDRAAGRETAWRRARSDT